MKHALIFAAGLGERMRPLTEHTPKPLLEVAGKPLIVWHLEKLAATGIQQVVINTSHLAGQFPLALGDGSRWGLRIHYSYEGPTPLETGGGMLNALPLLGDAPFLAINGDIWSDADLSQLPSEPDGVAHLLLVDNPPQHPQGDFALDANGSLHESGATMLTFSGIGVHRKAILDDWHRLLNATSSPMDSTPPRFGLAPLLRAHVRQGTVRGSHHCGAWTDVGTPSRLQALELQLGATGG